MKDLIELHYITHIGINFFGQYGYLLGRQLRQQTLHIHIIVFAQILAVQLGRRGERGCLCGGRGLQRQRERESRDSQFDSMITLQSTLIAAHSWAASG